MGERSEPWANSSRHLDALHRIGAAVVGLVLWAFAILGLVDRLDAFSTSGQPIFGLTSNTLLSVISLVVGAVLIAAGVRGGPTASTVTVVVGGAFLVSGVVNVLLLDTAWNVLAFAMPNVIFSLVVGGVLVILGAWGRFTGRLPTDNPYRRRRPGGDGPRTDRLPAAYETTAAAHAAAELADAERAAVRHGATPEEIRGVAAAGRARRDEDRLAGWQRHRDR